MSPYLCFSFFFFFFKAVLYISVMGQCGYFMRLSIQIIYIKCSIKDKITFWFLHFIYQDCVGWSTLMFHFRKLNFWKCFLQEARNEKSPDLAPTPAPQSTPRNTVSQSTSGDPEIDKKIKNLKKVRHLSKNQMYLSKEIHEKYIKRGI